MTTKISTVKLEQKTKFLSWFGIILLLIIALWLRMRYVWVNPFSYDEGHWLMFGVLVNKGHTAYTETFVGIPPLALLTIQLGDKLFHNTLGVRYPMMLVSLLGIAAIFLSFYPWEKSSNFFVGFLAAFFLAFDTEYFTGSGSIMAEVPAVSLAILSVVSAQQYAQNRKSFWLFLSGIAFALSLAFKIFIIFIPALIGLVIVFACLTDRNESWSQKVRQIIISGVVWLVGVLLPWAIFAVFYNFQAMFNEIFLFRLAFREVSSGASPFLQNVAGIGRMLINRSPLLVCAGLGVIVGWKKYRYMIWLWLAWFLLALFPLVWQSPLRVRYSVMLVPPLAALGAIAIVEVGKWVMRWLKQKQISHLAMQSILVMSSLVIMTGYLISPVQSAYLPASRDLYPDLNLDAVQYVWQNTTADDCIVTDDQRFAFAVDRLVPPALSETAVGRLATGWLTADDIVEQIVLHNCPVVVYADWRFSKYLPDLHQKLEGLYFLRIPFEQGVVVYVGQKNSTRQPDMPLQVQIGSSIELQGFDSLPTPWRGGQKVRLATYWTTLKQPETGYKIFLQLRNSGGEPVANFDHFPFPVPSGAYQPVPHIENPAIYPPEKIALYPQQGMLPTYAWPVNSTIREVVTLLLPFRLPPDTYNIYLGLYDPDTLQRLPVGRNGENNEILLTSVKVIE